MKLFYSHYSIRHHDKPLYFKEFSISTLSKVIGNLYIIYYPVYNKFGYGYLYNSNSSPSLGTIASMAKLSLIATANASDDSFSP